MSKKAPPIPNVTYAAATLNAIKTAVVLNSEEDRRTHLGASIIGRKCGRQVWYMFRWAGVEQHDGRKLRLFQRGHREEEVFIKLLRAAGIEVWDRDPTTGKQFRMVDHSGHYGGSCDGIGRGFPELRDEPAILEFKTHNDDSFQKVVKEGLLAAKYEHFVQCQQYMRYWDVKVTVYFAVNKNDDTIHPEIIRYQPDVAERFSQRAKDIIFADAPPDRVAETPGFWMCKFCTFSQLCHFDGIPDINCRTCVHAHPSKEGGWTCDRENPAITNQPQLGCKEHVFNPVFFNDWVVTGGDFEQNFIDLTVKTGTAQIRIGPKFVSSPVLKREGFVPF